MGEAQNEWRGGMKLTAVQQGRLGKDIRAKQATDAPVLYKDLH